MHVAIALDGWLQRGLWLLENVLDLLGLSVLEFILVNTCILLHRRYCRLHSVATI
jgi:hypothetical protein